MRDIEKDTGKGKARKAHRPFSKEEESRYRKEEQVLCAFAVIVSLCALAWCFLRIIV